MEKIDKKIELPDGFNRKENTKASEEYIEVRFIYPTAIWSGWIPVKYRRTGIFLKDNKQVVEYLKRIYPYLDPSKKEAWLQEQKNFWETKKKAEVTKGFFDVLTCGTWCCSGCKFPLNQNPQRRIQDLKEMGYTLATDTNMYCANCKKNKTHTLLIPLPRVCNAGNGYETWSLKLRKRIIRVLGGKDVYDGDTHCLPDHKFPEIRWDENTKSENRDDMAEDEIKEKFQLLTNQRNQQKREACRKCSQKGERGVVFEIPFFYQGGPKWDEAIPTRGKDAEAGCVGCPWYDLEEWRKQLLLKLNGGK